MRVVHQHRLGSCRGLLVVSRDGVAFVQDDHESSDQHGFHLQHGQFLHSLGRDNLTIKSNDRTYRFKAADASGTDDDQFARLVEALLVRPSGLR